MVLKEPQPALVVIALVFMFHCSLAQQNQEAVADRLFEMAMGGGNLDSTLLLATQVDSISKLDDYEYGKIRANLLYGFYLQSKLKLDTAISILASCEDYFKANPAKQNSLDHARTLYYMGMARHRNQEYALSKNYSAKALLIFESLGEIQYQVNCLNHLGIVEMVRDNYPQALAYYMRAYKLETNDGKNAAEISQLNHISIVYNRMGQSDKALEYARTALRIARRNGVPKDQINVLNSIGNTHNTLGNLDSALFYFDACTLLAERENNEMMAFNAQYNIANSLSNRGDYKRSNEIFKKARMRYKNVPLSMQNNGQLLVAKNFLKLNQFDSCLFVASSAYRTAKKGLNKQTIIILSDLLSSAFQRKQQSDSALHYLKIHFAYKDSVYNLESQRKLSTLYAEMETIEKENEIVVLQKQQTLDRAQNRLLQLTMLFGAIVTGLIILLLILGSRNRQRKQQLKNYELQNELDSKKKELHQHALRMIYINNGLSEVQDGLKKIKIEVPGSQSDVQHVLNSIHINKSLEKEWENFNEYFGSVHVGFYEKFNQAFPSLTILEKRLAGLIKMNLTNGEIASVLNIESNSVKMAKYRLKKKLALTDEQDLYTFLQQFGQVKSHS
jgi:tetratricopeptide (TPR) repeat protein/DNA-binding CsgD family transcriptional regulator